MIASDTLFDSRGWVFGVKLSDEDIADFDVLRVVAMATIFSFLYMGCTLAPPGGLRYCSRRIINPFMIYDVRRRCGLTPSYFDHLLNKEMIQFRRHRGDSLSQPARTTVE